MALFLPAFVTSSSTVVCQPVRRPRSSVCVRQKCYDVRLYGLRSRVKMQTQPSSSSEPPQTDVQSRHDVIQMTSLTGFALRDAQIHSFADLNTDETPFQIGGAYAISDTSGNIMYMGYSKNIAAKLAFHARLQPQSCASFRFYAPPVPPELMSPDMLENVLEYWVQEVGGLPKGNTVDRALWEQENPVDRKPKVDHSRHKDEDHEGDIPVRERTTQRRVPNRSDEPKYYSTDPFADAFRSPGTRRAKKKEGKGKETGWEPLDEDYVEVDVDPFDPFSASNRSHTTRTSWSELDDDYGREDWYPIFLIMGFAGLVWIFGLLSNALPAATPSLGM